MALLDDLVSQVPDVKLRERLKKALSDLRKRRRFGLVFEEHIPETTAIHGLSIEVGAVVQRGQEVDGKLFNVARLSDRNKSAVIISGDGREEKVPVTDLLLVKRFSPEELTEFRRGFTPQVVASGAAPPGQKEFLRLRSRFRRELHR